MKLQKITAPDAEETQIIRRLSSLSETDAPFAEAKVQGANIFTGEGILFVSSPRRFKLYTDARDLLLVREGEGHFKWARGETDFRAGEAFAIEQAGEYEVNGKCVFAVYRQK